jgi:enterochelin esterase family protein
MRVAALIGVIGFVAAQTIGSGQTSPSLESPAIAQLERDLSTGNRAAQDNFWKIVEQRRTPIVEPMSGGAGEVLATFLWKDPGDTRSVLVDARFSGVDPLNDPASLMTHIKGTDVWYLTRSLPADAELLYQLVVNPAGLGPTALRAARPDPLNPFMYPERDDPMYDAAALWRDGSIARMPAAKDNPWLVPPAAAARGVTREHEIKSALLTAANPRKVWVHVPPSERLERPRLLILFDGGTTYQTRIPTTAILDNLYAAGKIGTTVAVLVDNGGPARSADMTFSDDFVKFLADELVPWVQREYHFTAEPSRTALGGDSLCGLIGAYAALRRPDVFGAVLAQSGAFQERNPHDASSPEPEWLARQFASAPKSELSFYLEVGSVESRPEGNDGTSLLASNRHLRDVLIARGFAVSYTETYGDHDPVHWRRMLPDALMHLLG